MQLPTADQVKAASRHAGTAVASVLGTLAALKIISAGDLSSLQTSFDQISHGVAEIITGLTALSVAATTAFAAISASPLWQLIRGSRAVAADPSLVSGTKVSEKDQATVASAATKMPKVETVVADPAVANATPDPSVKSSAEVVVKEAV